MVSDSERKATGRQGEQAACDYLTAQGYYVVARNWHCRGGELDLVATQGEVIAFVEVKTRKVGAMVSPLQAVDSRKQRRTVLAASCYLASHHCELQPRFDVVAITVKGDELNVEHLPSAYDAGSYY